MFPFMIFIEMVDVYGFPYSGGIDDLQAQLLLGDIVSGFSTNDG